nr:hypothetical protein [uncultured Bacteroides sp.]
MTGKMRQTDRKGTQKKLNKKLFEQNLNRLSIFCFTFAAKTNSKRINMAAKPSIPKGTCDFSPVEMAKRNYMIELVG